MSTKARIALIVTLAAAMSLVVIAVQAGHPVREPGPTDDSSAQAPLGTGFTYQGWLESGDEPVSGDCSMVFRLYDAASSGGQVGSALTYTVPISDGLFIVNLDFGDDVFTGDARWLEIKVKCQGDTDYADLGRQELTPAPYALYALKAPWSGLAGVPAGFADDIDDNTTYSAGTGLALAGTEFSMVPAYRLPQSCSNGQIAEWNGSAWVCGDDDEGASGSFWSVSGNAGTTHGTHLLGTTDEVSLTLAVSNTVALRLEPNRTSPNLIGGYSGNRVTGGVVGGTVGGGGASGESNRVTDDYGTVGGGGNNQAGNDDADTTNAPYATVGGGILNTASGSGATVGGGIFNTGNSFAATVAGGDTNAASGYAAAVGGGALNAASGYAATVGGGGDNEATGYAATVGGGSHNEASGQYATVSGGEYNDAIGSEATVGGGSDNTASGIRATVGGGSYNQATADYATVAGGGGVAPTTGNRVTDDYGTVGGGGNNQAGSDDADTTNAPYAAVGGGEYNKATAAHATIGGGEYNEATGTHATVGGGYDNDATHEYTTIGGGRNNTATGDYAAVGGGEHNTITATHATVGGGYSNIANDRRATIGGGYNNAASGPSTTVGGGYSNTASGSGATVGGGASNAASGSYATIAGGRQNTADGDYSFAAGRRAKASNQGCFVWGDSTNTDVTCSNDDRWVARASGGVYFYTSSDQSTGAYLPSGGETWQQVSASDRNLKENFVLVDGQQILGLLADIPITTWNYKASESGARHISPMAQDFYAAFEVGEDDKHLSALDVNGVALAAIQGLYQQNVSLQAKSVALETENANLRSQMAALEARVAALEDGGPDGPVPSQGSHSSLLPWAGVLLAAAGLAWASRRRDVLGSPSEGGR